MLHSTSEAVMSKAAISHALNLIVVFAALLSCSQTDQSGPKMRKILYESDVDGNMDVFVMNEDGSEKTNRTQRDGYDGSPGWSPDGSRIVFVSDRDGDNEIFIMDADGSDPVQLTYNDANDGFPVWSPDGTMITFDSSREGEYSQVYVMSADGSGQRRLTYTEAEEGYVSFSADSKWIAFDTFRDGASELYKIRADGTGPTASPISKRISEMPGGPLTAPQ